MSELLGFVPVLASLVLGLVYLGMGEGSAVLKGSGIGVSVSPYLPVKTELMVF